MQLSTPRITVGLPVYKGADLIPKCLDCLQRQTFGDFEAIISVDGNDAETAAACRPYLADPRFCMVVHPGRLDWSGNFNWLLQQDLREFFCYRQHDDTTAQEFLEVLLEAADKAPNAAAVYTDCRYIGGRRDIEFAPSIEGEPLDRLLQYIERLPATPVRGLIRSDAIRQAGFVRSDEYRAVSGVFVWLAKLVRWGNFRRVGKPLYYRLDHVHSYTTMRGFTGKGYHDWPEDRKRGAWTTMFTGLLDAAIPFCRTPEERRFFQQAIFERIVVYPSYLYRPAADSNSERLITECLERLECEGNTHLLRREELSPILQQLKRRPNIKVLERSPTRRVIYRIRQRSQMARILYPRSRMRGIIYQIRYLLRILTK
jgi:glycosyltransferase involved in cell wall biosynthesis